MSRSFPPAPLPEDSNLPSPAAGGGMVRAADPLQRRSCFGWAEAPSPAAVIQDLDRRWQERAIALLHPCGDAMSISQRLQDLRSLSLEHYTSLAERHLEIAQLQLALLALAEALKQPVGQGRPELAAELGELVLRRYLDLNSTPGEAQAWLSQLHRLLERRDATDRFLRSCGGESLQAIGVSAMPPVSREAVRSSLSPLAACLGCSPRQIARTVAARREGREQQLLMQALQLSLERLGRFPFHSDGAIERLLGCDVSTARRLEPVARLNLNRRLALHADWSLPVPEAEWELHLRVIANNEEDAGPGYWHREQALREFLHRYAVLLGAPGLMPLQEQLPSAVRGAVQRHGRQSGVAARVGLRYQGQLTGESGRTYWTEQRLTQLLEQTATHSGLAAGVMPSRVQISAFLASGVVLEYLDKQPTTVFAALSRQGALRWPQVAERFGRVWQS